MKLVYGIMLRTLAVSLFSLTIIGNLNADAPAGGLTTTQVKTLDPNDMQGLAGADTLKTIVALEAEEDTGKQLEGIYNLLQRSQGQKFDTDVQTAFGKLVVKAFNDGTEVWSYLQQVIQDIITSKTPLLAESQLDYVEKQMLPHLALAEATHEEVKPKEVTKEVATPTETTATDKKTAKKAGKKGLKKGKHTATPDAGTEADEKTAKPVKAKKIKSKKGHKAEVAAAAHDDGAAAHDEITGTADAEHKPAKAKKAKGKKGKHAAASADATADTAAAATGDTTATDAAPAPTKGKGKKSKGKKGKHAAASADATAAAPAA